MRCRICGRDCPPGAKICRDCAAARKRAFAQTVTQPLLAAVGAPSVGEPRFAPKPPRRRAANDPTVERDAARAEPAALPLTAVPRKLGSLWMVGAAVLLTSAVVMLLLRTMGNGAHPVEEPAANETPPPAIAVPAPRPPQPTVSEAAPPTVDSEAPPIKVAPARASRRIAPHIEAPAPAVAEPPPEPSAAAVVRAPAPPPRPVEAPRPDPMQLLNEGLARCARQAIFDRIGCEQKLRQQYCGNSWGLVPQCPIGPATDHGQ
jgi:hypothetical protein